MREDGGLSFRSLDVEILDPSHTRILRVSASLAAARTSPLDDTHPVCTVVGMYYLESVLDWFRSQFDRARDHAVLTGVAVLVVAVAVTAGFVLFGRDTDTTDATGSAAPPTTRPGQVNYLGPDTEGLTCTQVLQPLRDRIAANQGIPQGTQEELEALMRVSMTAQAACTPEEFEKINTNELQPYLEKMPRR
jgi:hypothetical protein